jgi:hypothetical protein
LSSVYNTALLADAEESADRTIRAQITATKLSHTLVLTSDAKPHNTPREKEIKVISRPISISSSEILNPNSINRNAYITPELQVKDVVSEPISVPASEVSNSTNVNRLSQQEVKKLAFKPPVIRYFKKYL